MRRRNRCVATKRAYSTTDECIRVMKRVYKQQKVKLRHYECPVCLDFHLTHKGTKKQLFDAQSLWRNEDIKKKIAKQYKEFEILFNREWKRVYGTNKKKKTILKGVLPRVDRLRILAEMRNKESIMWLKTYCLLSRFDYSKWLWKSLKLLS